MFLYSWTTCEQNTYYASINRQEYFYINERQIISRDSYNYNISCRQQAYIRDKAVWALIGFIHLEMWLFFHPLLYCPLPLLITSRETIKWRHAWSWEPSQSRGECFKFRTTTLSAGIRLRNGHSHRHNHESNRRRGKFLYNVRIFRGKDNSTITVNADVHISVF